MVIAFIDKIIRHRLRDENTKALRNTTPRTSEASNTNRSKYFREWHHLMTIRRNERNNWSDVHVTANRYQLEFVFLSTAFAPSTSKSSGTSAVYCSFPPSIRIGLKFAWICGFRYHFTHNEPAGTESIQTHPKSSQENFPFGKSPKKKTLRLTLKYILTQVLFVCVPLWKTMQRLHGHSSLFTYSFGWIEGELLISYPNKRLSKLLTHSGFTNFCFSFDSTSRITLEFFLSALLRSTIQISSKNAFL